MIKAEAEWKCAEQHLQTRDVQLEGMHVSNAAETKKSERPFCGVLSLLVSLQPYRSLCSRSAFNFS